MTWNPCGRVVDYGSRPFKAKYRPFRDSDVEVEIEWFPAAPNALPLGFPSNITIPYWEQGTFEYDDGLLPLSTAEPTGKPVVRPGTGRGHVCGTERDFREGGHYDPDAEPVTYGQQGLPTCCGAPVVLGGGARDGGRVEVVTEIVPGTSCEDAPLIPTGVPTDITLPGPGIWWVKVATPGAGTWHTEGQILSGAPGLPGGLLVGPDCDNLSSAGGWTLLGCTTHMVPGVGFLWLRVSVFSGTAEVRLTSGPGPC